MQALTSTHAASREGSPPTTRETPTCLPHPLTVSAIRTGRLGVCTTLHRMGLALPTDSFDLGDVGGQCLGLTTPRLRTSLAKVLLAVGVRQSLWAQSAPYDGGTRLAFHHVTTWSSRPESVYRAAVRGHDSEWSMYGRQMMIPSLRIGAVIAHGPVSPRARPF